MKGRRILRPNFELRDPPAGQAPGFNEGPENSPAKHPVAIKQPVTRFALQ